MGIYDTLNVDIDIQTFKWPLIALVIIIVLVAIGSVLFGAFRPDPLELTLDGPIDLSVQANGYAKKPISELTVKLNNPVSGPVQNVSVFVEPQDPKSILVFQSPQTVPILDKSRTLSFTLRPNPIQNVLPGTYIINVTTTINGKQYAKSIELSIQTAS
ncbi:MAG: hypothetical protein V1777_03135 [Candidatus Micrarchaeota archaeon]